MYSNCFHVRNIFLKICLVVKQRLKILLKLISGHELSVMPASQRISLETNVIPETYEKPAPIQQQHNHHHHRHHNHHNNAMVNHESFLMCPGRRPVKIGSNQPVSINIFVDNFIRNDDNKRDNGEIYLSIKDGGIEKNNRHNHHANNHINAYHNNKLMNGKNTSKAATETSSTNVNKSGADRMQNNLIKNDNNHGNNNSNNDNKNIIENDGNVQHFINVYHWIVHSMADESATKSSGGKPKIVVRSSSVDLN